MYATKADQCYTSARGRPECGLLGGRLIGRRLPTPTETRRQRSTRQEQKTIMVNTYAALGIGVFMALCSVVAVGTKHSWIPGTLFQLGLTCLYKVYLN